jgi:hypothetical protein
MSLQPEEIKKLDPERQRGNTHPKTAYLMLGHGEELPETHIVPPGCMLVVDVHSGELTYTDFNEDFLVQLEHNEMVLNPIDNYNNVSKLMSSKKSLAIYREGDEYPDFSYTLISSWGHINNEKLVPEGFFLLLESGILQYPFEYKYPYPIQKIVKTTDSQQKFLDMYRMSVYPKRDSINTAILSTFKKLPRIPTLAHILHSAHTKIDSPLYKLLRIKQSELFEMVSRGELEPGIFYNLICRKTDETILKYNTNTETQILNNAIRNRSMYPSLNTRNNKKHTTPFFRKEIMGAIEEAELKRKPYIKYLQLNNRNTKETLKQNKGHRWQKGKNGKWININKNQTYKKVNGKWVTINNKIETTN